MDRGPWWAAVHGVAKSRAQLSDYHTTHDALWRHKYLLAPSVGEGNGTPIQYSCLENPMDGGAWWAAVHGVVKSRT